MKKLHKALALVMALMISATAFSTLTVWADGVTDPISVPTLPTVNDSEKEVRRYYFHEDFSELTTTTINTSASNVKNSGGFWLCNENNGSFSVENGYLKNDGTSYIDLQLYHLDGYSVTEDFVLSARMMPTSENISGNFINYVRGDSTNQKVQTLKNVINFKNGNVLVDGKDCGKMVLNEWLLIEVAFNYNTDSKCFDSYAVMLNGTKVSEAALVKDNTTDPDFTYLKHFRMFYGMGNYTYAVDDINIVAGDNSVLYAKDYIKPVIPESLPTVTDAEKEARRYYFHEDFSELTTETVNSGKAVSNNIKAAGGFWLCNEIKGVDNTVTYGDFFTVENGYLKNEGTKYIDLQMYHLDGYSVTEDFVLSARMMPMSDDISGCFIEFVRKGGDGDKSGEIVKFDKGSIVVEGVNFGKMTLNEWLLIEVVFHYNETSRVFDRYTVMLNGSEAGYGTLSNSASLNEIKHFRMFQRMKDYTYAVDDINIVTGDKSVLYAKDYTKPGIPQSLPTVTDVEKEERKYFFYEDFSDLTTETVNSGKAVTNNIKNAGGFWLCNEIKGADDTVTYGDFFTVENGYLKNEGTKYIDLQMFKFKRYSVTEDFVLSARMMPMSDNISGCFIEFVRKDSEKDRPKSDKIIKFDNGSVIVGGINLGKMTLNEWLLIEVAFHYNENSKVFDRYTVMLNGVDVGYGTLSNSATFDEIKHFRTFASMSDDVYAVDDIKLLSGNKSAIYAKDFDGTISLGNGDIENFISEAPTVSDADRKEKTCFFHEDFEELTNATINTNPNPNSIKKSGGFWLCNEDNGNFSVENGYLKNMGTAYIDLQLHHLSSRNFNVKEDFVLSVKMMPLSENISGTFINFLRRDNGVEEKSGNLPIVFADGYVFVNDKDCGKMKLNEWLLIEIAFHFNEETKLFDSYTVMLNGNNVGENTLDEALGLTQIKHFRTFHSMSDYTYAVDDFTITSGTESVLYAKNYTHIHTPEYVGDEDGGGQYGDGPNISGNGSNDDEFFAPATDASTAETDETKKWTDYILPISIGAAILAVACGVGAAVVIHRKKRL